MVQDLFLLSHVEFEFDLIGLIHWFARWFCSRLFYSLPGSGYTGTLSSLMGPGRHAKCQEREDWACGTVGRRLHPVWEQAGGRKKQGGCITSLKLTARTWKWMVGNPSFREACIPFGEGNPEITRKVWLWYLKLPTARFSTCMFLSMHFCVHIFKICRT